jgi:raffinose/stachyose/melibiose transport system permease protein
MTTTGTAVTSVTSGTGSVRSPLAVRRGRGKDHRGAPRRGRRMGLRLAVGILILVEVIPLIWLVLSSLKTNEEFFTRSVWSLPQGFYLHNYAEAFSSGMGLYLRNSAIATFPALVLILALSVAAAFGLEVMRWRGRSLVLLLFLTGIFIPAQMILLPLFLIYFKLGLINNLLSLIITYTAYGLPLSIFLLTAYYKSVPREIVEAATVDGASIYRVFWQVSLPMIRNAVVTVALVQFFFVWNDLLFSYTFISNADRLTVQTGLLSFVGQYGQISWGPTFAAVCIAVFPTLLIYLALNQKIMRGLTAGSLKG